MRSETAISIALYALLRERGMENLGFRSDVVGVLRSLYEHGVALGGIGFRSTPKGFQSDEVSEFLGRLAMAGYLVQESPIRLTSAGVELLQEHLKDLAVEKADEHVLRSLELLNLRTSLPSAESAESSA